MQTVELQVENREKLGKNVSKQLRKKGIVPAVVYGLKSEPQHIQMDAREYGKIFRQFRNQNVLIKLLGKDQTLTVLPKDVSRDAITREILHVDFLRVEENQPVTVTLQLKFVGTAPGVKVGGNLRIRVDHIQVRSLPGNIPSHIDIDLSQLGVGQSIRVRDIDTQNKFEILTTPDEVLILVESGKAQATPEQAA